MRTEAPKGLLESIFVHEIAYGTPVSEFEPGAIVSIDRVPASLGLLVPILSACLFAATKPLPDGADRMERDTKAKAGMSLALYGTAVPAVILASMFAPGQIRGTRLRPLTAARMVSGSMAFLSI